MIYVQSGVNSIELLKIVLTLSEMQQYQPPI